MINRIIVVTGGAGFVGGNLIEKIKNKEETNEYGIFFVK